MQEKKQSGALVKVVLSMLIFGTIGIFRKMIPFSSSAVAFFRSIVSAPILGVIVLLRREKPGAAFKKYLPLLILSGAMLGFNWIALFEAYNYVSVATATLCYYMAPVFVMLLSPIILHERLNRRQGLCVLAALIGMVLVSGVIGGGTFNPVGILLGLCAAGMYAMIVLLNKKMSSVPPYTRTFLQLSVSAVTVFPYVLLRGEFPTEMPGTDTILIMLFVCLVHTALAYALYFSALPHLKAHTAALLSYLDPVVAVVLSELILHEPMTVFTLIGAVLIIGAAILSEKSDAAVCVDA